MKNKFTFRAVSLCVFLILGSICVYVGAQQPGAKGGGPINSSDALESAVTLLNVGDAQDATNVIASIPQNAPEYPAAQCYRALSMYQLGDYRQFLEQMGSEAVQGAVVSPQVREDLDYKQINALFYYRKFDDVLPKIQAFQTQHRTSAHVGPLAEYQMAALFERGMKKLEEVSRTLDTNQLALHRADAQASLNRFLSLSTKFNNYNTITNRTLKEDNWRARIMLGDDAAAFNAISPTNTVDQERFSLLRLQLSARLQPLGWDHNFELRTNFLNKFPNSKNRKRVEFDTVDVSFPLGKKLLLEADAAKSAGDTATAATKRAGAHSYFQIQRSLLSGLRAGKDVGIEDWDLFELREDLLYGYYLEKDFTTLSSVTASILADAKPGGLDWLLGKFFTGVVKLNQSSPDTTAASAAFEEVLATGFKDKADHDHLVIGAAKWRIRMALSVRDKQKALDLYQWVQAGNCKKNIKSEFLNEYAGVVGLQK